MSFLYTVAASGPNSSDAITELLGVVATIAFLGIALYIVVLYLQDAAGRNQKTTMQAKQKLNQIEEQKTLADFDEDFGREVKRLESSYRDFYDQTIEQATLKFEELVAKARSSFERISTLYGSGSQSASTEDRANNAKLFKNVCSRQWASFKPEIRYIRYGDIERHLRHILDSYKMIGWQKNAKNGEIDPDIMRTQEIISLIQTVSKKQVPKMQSEMLKALEPFSDYYEREVREWLNNRLFKVIEKAQQRGEHGVTISDTTMKEKLNVLKTCVETLARLSEVISQRTHEINDPGIALSQIVYVGTVLDILGNLVEWFPGQQNIECNDIDDLLATSAGKSSAS